MARLLLGLDCKSAYVMFDNRIHKHTKFAVKTAAVEPFDSNNVTNLDVFDQFSELGSVSSHWTGDRQNSMYLHHRADTYRYSDQFGIKHKKLDADLPSCPPTNGDFTSKGQSPFQA